MHLPQSASFCVKQGKTKYEYQTDNYGGRLLYTDNSNNKVQVFGDSQVLGLDVENVEQHYLNTLYKKSTARGSLVETWKTNAQKSGFQQSPRHLPTSLTRNQKEKKTSWF